MNRECIMRGEMKNAYSIFVGKSEVKREFFDAKLIICITFLDKPGEGSTQLIGFKIWPRIRY
jgi:hypothetical protein